MSTVTAVPLRPVKRGYLVWLWLGLALALVSAFALARASDTGVRVTESGLRYRVIKAGEPDGVRPTNDDVALVSYEGRLADGTVFDRSQQPTPMPVAGVVPGFSEALKMMTRGAKHRVWLPPELAYGANGAGPIPPNATLEFDLELVDFRSQAELMRQMQGATPPGAPAGRR
jgi:FKBP-type peptidyl-prolyl cis-trans isomerase FkpA